MSDDKQMEAERAPIGKDEAIDLLRDAVQWFDRLSPNTLTAREVMRLTARLASAIPPSPSTAPMCERKTEGLEQQGYAKTGYVLRGPGKDRGVVVSDGGAVSWFTTEQWNWLMFNRDHVEFNWPKPISALASRPAEVDGKIPRESNDALIKLAKYWKLDGDWMTCRACRRSLIASRDGEELNHGDGCKFWDQQHPWAQLRGLIARRPTPAESAP